MYVKGYSSRQQGFTLVEIAVVLVIIGLLIGGVLKGTELIDNSKVKKAVSQINGISAAYNAYQDRYNRIPGDDGNAATLQARGGVWATITQGGNNNGAIRADLGNTWNGGNEHDNFWQHLRAAGFITGDASLQGVNSLPRNSYGGLMGITVPATGGGLNGLKVCMSQIPGKAAQAIDTQLDNGLGATGQVRAILGAAGTNTNPTNAALAVPYDEGDVYTICAQI